jgi:hypothetical protein
VKILTNKFLPLSSKAALVMRGRSRDFGPRNITGAALKVDGGQLP